MSVRKIKDKRESIMNSAIRVFARKGFENARISDIAEEAGTAYGLVYHYFKSKEELLNFILQDKWRLFLTSITEIDRKEKIFKDKVSKITEVLIETYRSFPELMRVIVVEYSRSPRFVKDHKVRKPFLEVVDVFENMVREAKKRGEVRECISPRSASIAYFGAIDAVFTFSEIGGREKGIFRNVKRMAEEIINIYLQGVCRR